MTQRKTPNPTLLDADYYPRMKIHRRWYLIVPEIDNSVDFSWHSGCAFYRPEQEKEDNDWSMCSLVNDARKAGYEGYLAPEFKRHDCGDNGTIFVAPSKFPEYRAQLVVQKLEGKP